MATLPPSPPELGTNGNALRPLRLSSTVTVGRYDPWHYIGVEALTEDWLPDADAQAHSALPLTGPHPSHRKANLGLPVGNMGMTVCVLEDFVSCADI